MNYTLYNADCLDILPTLDAGSVDAVICDPPYGTTACKWDSVIPFAPMWEGIRRVLKPRGACVLFGSQPFTSALVMSNPKWFRYEWVWEKTNAVDFALANIRPRKLHENVVVFSENAHTYNPQMAKGVPYIDKPRKRTNAIHGSTMPNLGIVNDGTRFPSSVIKCSNPNSGSMDAAHPTQKPLALLEYLVKTYTNAGDTVLDFTMGSGTTGHACGNLDRRFIGIEKDEPYFKIAEERIATAYAPLRMMQAAV